MAGHRPTAKTDGRVEWVVCECGWRSDPSEPETGGIDAAFDEYKRHRQNAEDSGLIYACANDECVAYDFPQKVPYDAAADCVMCRWTMTARPDLTG